MTEEQLDDFGREHGIARFRGESNDVYEARLNRSVWRGSCSSAADIGSHIEDSVPQCSGTSVHSSPGRVRVRMELPMWRRLLWFPARADRKLAQAAMQQVAKAGVDWKVS
jgi:hypothetical protein